MSGNRRHAGGMKSAMDNLKKVDERIAVEQRSSNVELAEALEAAVIFLAPGIDNEPLREAAKRLRSIEPAGTPPSSGDLMQRLRKLADDWRDEAEGHCGWVYSDELLAVLNVASEQPLALHMREPPHCSSCSCGTAEPPSALSIFAEWAAGAACDDEYAPKMVRHIASLAQSALDGKVGDPFRPPPPPAAVYEWLTDYSNFLSSQVSRAFASGAQSLDADVAAMKSRLMAIDAWRKQYQPAVTKDSPPLGPMATANEPRSPR